MVIPKLALRNMLGAGMKTWLNALVLSFAYVAIIWGQSLFMGIDEEASRVSIDAEFGGGQYWALGYDPYDPFTVQDAHQRIEGGIQTFVTQGRATPILVTQGTIYPAGHIQPVLLKGIDPAQKILTLPARFLQTSNAEIPALVGSRMAQLTGLKKDDTVTVRWRDVHGTFDAKDLVIVEIFETRLQTIDSGQVWIPLKTLQDMTGMENQATIVVLEKNFGPAPDIPGWTFRDLNYLLQDIRRFVRTKSIGFAIFYTTLTLLAMLAIFNTQVLSIWRRRKEIGTLMALGMQRIRVIQLFTLEGALQAVLATLVGAVYGIPLLIYMATYGYKIPSGTAEGFGLALSEKLYPVYSVGLVLASTTLVLVTTTIVSLLPTRKIAKLQPTDALRGKLP
jgi:putative ABC transport system permease protein